MSAAFCFWQQQPLFGGGLPSASLSAILSCFPSSSSLNDSTVFSLSLRLSAIVLFFLIGDWTPLGDRTFLSERLFSVAFCSRRSALGVLLSAAFCSRQTCDRTFRFFQGPLPR